jgi:hypothetical protein
LGNSSEAKCSGKKPFNSFMIRSSKHCANDIVSWLMSLLFSL